MKRKLIAGAVAAAAVAAAGGAFAATQLDSPQAQSQAVVNDAAQQLGVSPTKLSDALKKAVEKQVDAAVSAGRMTQAQGEAMKSAIEAGNVPLFGGPALGFGHRDGGGPMLQPAATYLGLTTAELQSKLAAGKSLADVAKDQGKSVDGLVQALVDDAKQHLSSEVSEGHLTQTQADGMLSDLEAHITDMVNGSAPTGPPPGGAFGFHA